MWLVTTLGFFSVVQKDGESDLTVRARSRGDLDRLREQFLPDLGPTVEGAGTDYQYRAKVSHQHFSAGAARMTENIDYDNFKNAVAKRMGHQRASAYSNVWRDLWAISKEEG